MGTLGLLLIRGKNVALPLAPYVLNTDDVVFKIFNILNDSGVDMVYNALSKYNNKINCLFFSCIMSCMYRQVRSYSYVLVCLVLWYIEYILCVINKKTELWHFFFFTTDYLLLYCGLT